MARDKRRVGLAREAIDRSIVALDPCREVAEVGPRDREVVIVDGVEGTPWTLGEAAALDRELVVDGDTRGRRARVGFEPRLGRGSSS